MAVAASIRSSFFTSISTPTDFRILVIGVFSLGVRRDFVVQTVMLSPTLAPRFGVLRTILFPGRRLLIFAILTPAIIEIIVLPLIPLSLRAASVKS